MHSNMVSFVGFAGSSTSVAYIYIYLYIHTKPQIEHDYLPHANAFSNKESSKAMLLSIIFIYIYVLKFRVKPFKKRVYKNILTNIYICIGQIAIIP